MYISNISCIFLFIVVVVKGADDTKVVMDGPMGLHVTFHLETATIQVCRLIPDDIPKPKPPLNHSPNTTIPPPPKINANTSKTYVIEYAFKSIQQWDDGKEKDKMDLEKCEKMNTVMEAPLELCMEFKCHFGKDVASMITLCPKLQPSNKSFLLIKVHLSSFTWCLHDNQTHCPDSQLQLDGHLKTYSKEEIKKEDKELKMKGMDPAVEFDVVAFRVGSNTSHAFIFKQYHENNMTRELKTILTLPKPQVGMLGLKIKHVVAFQNTSIQLQIGLDPGYQKVIIKKTISLATVAKATILDILVVMVLGIWNR